MTEIIIATDMWEGDEQGVITTWLVDNGEHVTAGTLIADIMVEKIQHELFAPSDGTLVISVDAEVPISKGQSVGMIE